MPAPDWFTRHLGWKSSTAKTRKRCAELFGEPVGPNLADLSSSTSTRIAGEVYRLLGIPLARRTTVDIGALEARDDDSETPTDPSRTQPSSGSQLEAGLEEDIRSQLAGLDPGRGWIVTRKGGAQQFSQYEHLQRLQELFDSDRTLKSTLGRDYHVSTDVMVAVPNHWDVGPSLALHAAVSSKLTIRSDRVQNIRFEFGTLVRNRKGRLPHLVVVTAEPLPSRLVSIARGTGEIDAVYHLLFDEMEQALDMLRVESKALAQQHELWCELVDTHRMRPYSELAAILAHS